MRKSLNILLQGAQMESLQMESLQCHDESGVINIARGDSANNTASSPAPPRVMSPKHFET